MLQPADSSWLGAAPEPCALCAALLALTLLGAAPAALAAALGAALAAIHRVSLHVLPFSFLLDLPSCGRGTRRQSARNCAGAMRF
jgi:hypothetical protein